MIIWFNILPKWKCVIKFHVAPSNYANRWLFQLDVEVSPKNFYFPDTYEVFCKQSEPLVPIRMCTTVYSAVDCGEPMFFFRNEERDEERKLWNYPQKEKKTIKYQ